MNVFSPVMELRQYTLRRSRRADFKRLFASRFVVSQVLAGIRLYGWFDDLDDADRFVWMRGFASMEARAEGLAAFYGSEVWKAHRDEANSMIVDSDNVLLLRPVSGQGDAAPPKERLGGVLQASVHYLRPEDAVAFDAFFSERMLPRIEANGGSVIGRLRTHAGPNNFPRLPVRESEWVYAWIAQFGDESAQVDFAARMRAESGWRDDVPDPLLATVMRKPEVLRLRA